MQYRTLGKTGMEVSAVGLGTWQLGGKWGAGFDAGIAEQTLQAAVDQGVNFLDTADVYKDRASEAMVGRFVRSRPERLYVATKCGRRLDPHTAEQYQPEALRRFVEDSLRNTGLDTLDLIQLHCPPSPVYYRPEIFELFDRLREEGKIRHLGVSIEKVEEGLKAIEYPNVAALQVIFNPFRQRPAELLLREARRRDVGIIVRVPLASGLLTGKFQRQTTFPAGDHRHFNREGAAFDRGETFAGIPYAEGLDAVAELKQQLGSEADLISDSLRWILGHPEVSTVIPGASGPDQAAQNARAADAPPLDPIAKAAFDGIYRQRIAPHVHQRW